MLVGILVAITIIYFLGQILILVLCDEESCDDDFNFFCGFGGFFDSNDGGGDGE